MAFYKFQADLMDRFNVLKPINYDDCREFITSHLVKKSVSPLSLYRFLDDPLCVAKMP